MNCLKDALRELLGENALVESLPPAIIVYDLPLICDQLGLVLFSEDGPPLAFRPYYGSGIVVINASGGRYFHAKYCVANGDIDADAVIIRPRDVYAYPE